MLYRFERIRWKIRVFESGAQQRIWSCSLRFWCQSLPWCLAITTTLAIILAFIQRTNFCEMIPPARGNCRLGARREASADVRLCGGCRSGREAAPVACAALEYPRGDRHRLLWRLLRVRLHRAARATSQPPTPLLKYRHRVAPGGLQPSQHRRDARLRGHHRPFGNAEALSIFGGFIFVGLVVTALSPRLGI